MTMILSESDQQAIRTRAARLEAHSGIEIVTAIRARSDDYPELPWKAFGFVASLAAAVQGIAVLAGISPVSGFGAGGFILGSFLPALLAALVTMLVPAFARWWLDPLRAETEVRQAGQSLFLDHELFGTRDRNGLLILISLFERRVLLLPDRGLRDRLASGAWEAVVASMQSALRANRPVDAMLAGLDRLEQQLLQAGVRGASRDEIESELLMPGDHQP